MSILNTGAPHFKSVMKQHRHANYTLPKVTNEFIDNIIKKTDEIRIYTQVDDTNKLQEIRVSDNYIQGFDNLDSDGLNNPFNMGHIKSAHEDDSETSEFGVGMKAGALSAANQLNVYTKISNSDGTYKYIEVICDFIRMSNEIDVNSSYNPRIRIISYDEYREQHPFEYGSTLKLSKIRDCIYSKTTTEEITEDLSNCISETYSRFISKGKRIFVNNSLVITKYDFFEDINCEPFTISKELFILEKSGMFIYLIRKTKEISVWQEFNRDNSRWIKLKEHNDGLVYIQELIKSGYRMLYTPFNEDGVCMLINTTFTFYSNKYHTKHPKLEPDLPEDSVYIYKDDRNYGKQSLLKHNNGVHNYTLHEIDFVSKRLGKDLGITFNKEILMNGNNDLIIVIKSALMDSREEFTADISSKKNYELCEKAIKKGLINLMTCPEAKLSAGHRTKRLVAGDNSFIQFDIIPSKKITVKNNTKTTYSDSDTESVSSDSLTNLSDKNFDIIKNNNDSFINNNEENVDSKQENVDSKQENVDSKQENVDSNQENVDSKQENVDSKQENVDSNQENVDSNQENVDSKQENVDSNERDTKSESGNPVYIGNDIINDEENQNKDDEISLDIEDRRRRTIIIIDKLNKTLYDDNDNILQNDVLKLFESILS